MVPWNYVGFSSTAGCKLPWQNQKNRNAIIVDENRKPKIKFEKTSKPWKKPKPKKRSYQVGKPKNRTKHWRNVLHQRNAL